MGRKSVRAPACRVPVGYSRRAAAVSTTSGMPPAEVARRLADHVGGPVELVQPLVGDGAEEAHSLRQGGLRGPLERLSVGAVGLGERRVRAGQVESHIMTLAD